MVTTAEGAVHLLNDMQEEMRRELKPKIVGQLRGTAVMHIYRQKQHEDLLYNILIYRVEEIDKKYEQDKDQIYSSNVLPVLAFRPVLDSALMSQDSSSLISAMSGCPSNALNSFTPQREAISSTLTSRLPCSYGGYKH
jgi:hypothetical protein